MTEQNSLGDNNTQSQNISSDNATNSTGSVSAPAEKMLRQSEVTAIAGRAKQEGYDKAVREIAEKQPSAAQPVYQQTQQQQQPSQVGGVAQLTQEQILRMIDERAPQAFAQQVQQHQYLNTANQFIQKLEAGKVDYPGFDQKVAALNLPTHTELLPLLNTLDQGVAAGVLDDMADNPRKLADLKVLNMMNPQLAAIELNKLADSVRQNKAATQVKTPNEPLGQIKTSVTGADNSPLTVAEIKRQPQYRV